ncbi:hypothetical protein Mgra_00007904, partial [Meloidogyne graminicola]
MLPPSPPSPFQSTSLFFPSTNVSLKNDETKFQNYETSLLATLSPTLPSSPLQQQVPNSSPLYWEAQYSHENLIFLNRLRLKINCFCHIELLNAQFVITHNEETNDFFVELLPTNEARFAVPLLCVLFRFLPNEPEHFQIFSSSYGNWRNFGSVQRCSRLETFFDEIGIVESKQLITLSVHVFEHFFSIELNGKEIERHKHGNT